MPPTTSSAADRPDKRRGPSSAPRHRSRLLLGCLALAACDNEPTGLTDADCPVRLPTMRIGEVATVASSGGDGAICVMEPVGGTFVAVPFIASDLLSLNGTELIVRAEGHTPLIGTDPVSRAATPGPTPIAPLEDETVARRDARAAFDARMRALEREHLTPLIPRLRRPSTPEPYAAPPAPVSVGDVLSLNVNSAGSCDVLDPRSTRVVAVTR